MRTGKYHNPPNTHRYGGHANSTAKERLGKAMLSSDFAMVLPDLPGHGYSEGERAYVDRYSHWIDDIFQVCVTAVSRGRTLQLERTTEL